ncbi:MAG: histidine phosphatase family protein [Sinobacteraceae bacterium]|nr:histidine phosphatase family protein [Nevskiaceae bacterium]
MRRLTLLRHAEAQPLDYLRISTDRDRPLTQDGEALARNTAQDLANTAKPPTHILASPATRTLQTARIMAAALGLGERATSVENRIYEASPEALFSLIRQQSDAVEHLLLCGHNPGISLLVHDLAAGDPPPPLAPCELVTLDFEIENWAEIRTASGQQQDT